MSASHMISQYVSLSLSPASDWSDLASDWLLLARPSHELNHNKTVTERDKKQTGHRHINTASLNSSVRKWKHRNVSEFIFVSSVNSLKVETLSAEERCEKSYFVKFRLFHKPFLYSVDFFMS